MTPPRLFFFAGLVSCAISVSAQAPLETDAALCRALCRGRRPCRVEEVHDAGVDESGRAMRVARVLLSRTSHPHSDGSMAHDGDCARFAWLLAVQRRGGYRVRHLVDICNNGYGARGSGEDAVRVAPNRFTHERSGGSAWGWSESITLSLSPLALVSRYSSGFWHIGYNYETSEVQPATLTAVGTWWAPPCPPQAEDTPPEDTAPEDRREIRWIAIPRAQVGASELAALRAGAGLGSCAARIDGLAPSAALAGRADPSSATLRALWCEGGPLVVEIEDETITERDALEIWLGGARPSYMEHCRDLASVEEPQRIRIEWTEGQVEVTSTTVAPRVERIASAGVVRFFVELPSDVATMTIAYDDDDAGVSRRIASSTLDPHDAASLGAVASFGATCALEHGVLVPRVDTRVTGAVPVVRAD